MMNWTGELHVEKECGSPFVSKRFARYPLRFLFQEKAHCAWVYLVSFGGGIVAGDMIKLSVIIGRDSCCVITTQASTKVYKTSNNAMAEQFISYQVQTGAVLFVAPEPITCFRDSAFKQHQEIRLEQGANLVFVDWITSGRTHENWVMRLYENRISIYLDSQLVCAENMVLQGNNPQRMGMIKVFATVILIGDKVVPLLQKLQFKNTVSKSSLIDNQGIVFRFAGENVADVRNDLGNIMKLFKIMTDDQVFV